MVWDGRLWVLGWRMVKNARTYRMHFKVRENIMAGWVWVRVSKRESGLSPRILRQAGGVSVLV